MNRGLVAVDDDEGLQGPLSRPRKHWGPRGSGRSGVLMQMPQHSQASRSGPYPVPHLVTICFLGDVKGFFHLPLGSRK